MVVYSISNEYMNMITESGLNWHITDQINRRRLVQGVLQESTLDQVFCSNDALINKVNIISPIGRTDHKKGSDHMCIIVEININVDEQQKYIETSKQNWSKISQDDLLKKSLDVNWSYTSQNLSSQEMWEELHGKLMENLIKSHGVALHYRESSDKGINNGPFLTQIQLLLI